MIVLAKEMQESMIENKRIEELISKYLLGTLNDDEGNELNNWLRASEANESIFNNICSSHNFSKRYKVYEKADTKKAWKHFKQTYVYPQYRQYFYRYAAILLIPIMLAGGLWMLSKRYEGIPVVTESLKKANVISPGVSKALLTLTGNKKILLNSSTRSTINIGISTTAVMKNDTLVYLPTKEKDKATNVAEQESKIQNTLGTHSGNEFWVTLEDGTKIHLNYNTSLRYPIHFGSDHRTVYLNGEAYFSVAKDSRPFYVITESGVIRDYGTEFNVNTFRPSKTEVVLVKGRVSIAASADGGNEFFMKPGQLGCVENSAEVKIKSIDMESYISWNSGRFVFNDSSLGDIMETMKHWYRMDVEFEPESLRHLHFTGNVDRYGSIAPILNAIAQTTNLQITIKGRKVIIKSSY